MVCRPTGKQAFSRKFSSRVLRRHRKDACAKCLSGEYRWCRYVCWADGHHRHVGHLWLGWEG